MISVRISMACSAVLLGMAMAAPAAAQDAETQADQRYVWDLGAGLRRLLSGYVF